MRHRSRPTDLRILTRPSAQEEAGFRKGILGKRQSDMMCAAVCYPLASLLNISGVKCEAVESDLGECNHVWIRLADGRALDPTGDQFNLVNSEKMPPVYLGPPLKIHALAPEPTP